MTKAKSIYTMTDLIYGLIVRKRQAQILENKTTRGVPFQRVNLRFAGIEEGILKCRQCQKRINVGDIVVSAKSRRYARQYHKACAEALKII